MQLLISRPMLLLSLFLIHVYCDQHISQSTLLFEQDQLTRQLFEPSTISIGLFGVEPNHNLSSSDPVGAIDLLLGPISESSPVDLLPASTAWKFFRASLQGHRDELVVNASSLQLSYIYTNSTGLMPTSMALFRRGNPLLQFLPSDYVDNNDQWEFPARVILQKTGNGTFRFPPPFEDISNAYVFGNNTFGRTIGDCSADVSNREATVSGYTQVRREDCMGVTTSIADDYNCWSLNQQCHEQQVCTAEQAYNPEATCAFLQVNPRRLNNTLTFSDLLNDVSSWSLDPPTGTGSEFQRVLILTKDERTRFAPNKAVTDQTLSQLQRTSDAVESLLSWVISNAESSISPKPSKIDLALVCAAILSSLLAVDAVRIYKYVARIAYRFKTVRLYRRIFDVFVCILATIIACSPALMTTGVIFYQEIERGTLQIVRASNGWHAQQIWDALSGETVWWIRRVLVKANVSTSGGVRALYVVLPLCFLALDVGVEVFRVIRYRYREHAHVESLKQSGAASQESSQASLE